MPTDHFSALPDQDDIVGIAVMGATGSGKSTFINLVSGSNLAIGRGLSSCTSQVEATETFTLDGRFVTLIDTPGFDDSRVSDTDVLKKVALFLSSTYKQGYKLSGVIYMHRISDIHVGGIGRRNFSMFRKLCGDENLKNVVIVTNMWGLVALDVGERREMELRTDPTLFQPALDSGAEMLRHHNTLISARAIIRHIFKNHPLPLRIQRELVDEHKNILQTTAGKELDRQLMELIEKHRAEIADLQHEMEAALAERDLQTKRELDAARQELLDTIKKIENDRERLSKEYEDEKQKADERVRALELSVQEERNSRESETQLMAELIQLMRASAHASAEDKAAFQMRIAELEKRRRRLRYCHFQ